MKKLWGYISSIGYSEDLGPEEARRIQLLCRLNFISFDVLLVYLIVEIAFGIFTFMPVIIGMMVFVCIDLYLIHKRYYILAKHLAVILVSASIGFFMLYTGDNFNEALYIPLIAMPLIIFRDKRIAVFYLLYVLALIILLKDRQASVTPLIILSPKEMAFFRVLNVCSAALVTYFITFYFKAANEEYESALVGMNELISEKNKEITDSIEYAKHIQNGILPSAGMVSSALPDSFVFYRPKDIVAGDFYWLEIKKDHVIFAACDCTGHGVPGAMVSMICSNALNRAVKEFGLLDPGAILTQVRELVLETFAKSEREVKDGMDVSLCVWNKTSNELSWAGANNPVWIVSDKQLKEIKPDKQPIGKTDQPKPFTTHKMQLRKGDIVYIFTDGYADQFGGQKGKKFKYKQLENLLLLNADQSMAQQRDSLEEHFNNWKGELQQVDDVLVIGTRI